MSIQEPSTRSSYDDYVREREAARRELVGMTYFVTSNWLTALLWRLFLGRKRIPIRRIRVFRVNDCDWVAARTSDEAVKWYCLSTGLPRDEAIEEYLLQECDLKKVAFYRDEYRAGEPNCSLKDLIREHANGILFPQVIASTEY